VTTVNPAAHPGTSQQAVVEAALVLLERMGLSRPQHKIKITNAARTAANGTDQTA
jgi:hypothetical protein